MPEAQSSRGLFYICLGKLPQKSYQDHAARLIGTDRPRRQERRRFTGGEAMRNDGIEKVTISILEDPGVRTVVHVEVGEHRPGNQCLRVSVTPSDRHQGIHTFLVCSRSPPPDQVT